MTGLDLSRLAPSDAAVALRSLPRRFRAVLVPPLDDDPRPADADDLVHRIGPDGHSAIDHATHVVRSLTLIDRALEQVVTLSEPMLHPAVVDDHARWVDHVGPEPEPVDVVDDLTAATERLARRVERVAASDWARTAPVAGEGGTVSALDLLREAVGRSVEHLHAADRTVAAMRGRPSSLE